VQGTSTFLRLAPATHQVRFEGRVEGETQYMGGVGLEYVAKGLYFVRGREKRVLLRKALVLLLMSTEG
jgi:hypothetical protein